MSRLLSAALMLLCLSLTTVLAQSNTGRLVGTVSDSSGVIPGATIAIKDNGTSREQTVIASDDGTFTVPQLEVGSYTVSITATGHKTFTANDVKIDVGRQYTLNATLEAGEISENVTVTAGADILNATTGELSNTVSRRQIQELPLNGRDPTVLIQLQTGTASNGAAGTAINGQRTSFTNITRDGINIQDNFIRANASTFSVQRPTTDDVAEFTLTAQNAGADQGYGASQIQFVTPRGQNEFHGAGFGYNRNSKFAANDFFSNANSVAKPFLNQNQFGGRLGGPILKNKLFFFGSFEHYLIRTQSSELRTILTPSARNGVFTYVDNAGVTRTINLLAIAGTGITSIDPIIQSRILANLPTGGNSTATGDQRNTTGFAFNQRSNYSRHTYLTRVDYDINSRNTLNGVFSYVNENVLDRNDIDRVFGGGFGSAPEVIQPAHRKFLALAYRTTPTAKFTNELRGGLFLSDPVFKRTTGLPAAKLTLPLISSPEVNFENQGRISNTYDLQDTADYQWGNHSLRFGGQAQFFRINNFASFDTVPNYTLGVSNISPALVRSNFPGGISSAQLTNANSLFAILGGIVGTATQTFNVADKSSGYVAGATQRSLYAFENYGFYVSDQWRVSPRLTLNLGLRYDIFTGLREQRGLGLEPVIPNGTNLINALLNPVGTVDFIGHNAGRNQFFNTDKNNFAPIFSFAYTPQFKNKFLGQLAGDGRTVIRGGFRMSYVNDEFIKAADNAQLGNNGLSTAIPLPTLNARLNALPAIPTPSFHIPRTFQEDNDQTGFSAIFGINPNIQVPRTVEYSFGIQRELGFQTAIELRYVGGRSNNLWRGTDYNQVDIFNNGFLADFNRARANLLLTGNPACTSAGCQTLTVFPNLAATFFGAGVINNALLAGDAGQLAFIYQSNLLQGDVQLVKNPNAGPVDVLDNTGKYRYNSLQAEIRRRFAQGLYFQANYTFQKTLTDASGVTQTNFEPNLDNADPHLEYARADYDQTHIFNFNGIYELPFGKGQRWLSDGNWTNRLVGGFQFGSIVRLASGAPLTIVDPRGSLNRAARSGRQTPQTSLTKDEIKKLIGVFRTPNGVYFINPSVINPATGRAAEGYGTTPFAGQVFFNNAPGQTGSLERAFINGPVYINWDASLIKNVQVNERLRFQLRAEVFNVLNRANFGVGVTQNPTQFGTTGIFNINSPNFGRFTETFAPRIVQFAARIEF
jgi:hypothetical protein